MLKKLKVYTVLTFSSLFLIGCAALPRQDAPPQNEQIHAKVDGVSKIRYFINSESGIQHMIDDLKNHQKNITPRTTIGNNYLTISGGGDDGAFGAGLLVGWTQKGDRPNFRLVTGVSTGALIAPFAFLGSGEDETLKEVYTHITPMEIFESRNLISGLLGDGMASNNPLYKLIQKHINKDLMAKIAYEYQYNNRWLLIETTDIDAGVPVIWNMGAIASLNNEEGLHLFRKVMLASAAIPGAFPPVMFDVTVNGNHYQEMHVDGGAIAQVFLLPNSFFKKAKEQGLMPIDNQSLYVIRNGRLDSESQTTRKRTIDIAKKSIEKLIQSQGYGDLYQIYFMSKKYNIKHHLAYIHPNFTKKEREEFDPVYMNELFNYAREQATHGYNWAGTPPGIQNAINEDIFLQMQNDYTPSTQ